MGATSQRARVPVDTLAQFGPDNPAIARKIELSREQLLKLLIQRGAVEQSDPGFFVNENIDIAVEPLRATRRQTNEANPRSATTLDETSDLIALFSQQFLDVHEHYFGWRAGGARSIVPKPEDKL
jgi:hypothetical protein